MLEQAIELLRQNMTLKSILVRFDAIIVGLWSCVWFYFVAEKYTAMRVAYRRKLEVVVGEFILIKYIEGFTFINKSFVIVNIFLSPLISGIQVTPSNYANNIIILSNIFITSRSQTQYKESPAFISPLTQHNFAAFTKFIFPILFSIGYKEFYSSNRWIKYFPPCE